MGSEHRKDKNFNNNRVVFDCDWRAGIEVRPGFKGTLGYLLDWSGCGGLKLKRDIEVRNPLGASGSDGSLKCVGLISKFTFKSGDEKNKGAQENLHIKAYVSAGTAAGIRAKIAYSLPTPRLQLAWLIIGYDEIGKQWFEASYLKSGKTAEANLDSKGGKMQISIKDHSVRLSRTLDVNVYGFDFQVVPASGKTCMLEFANGTKLRLIKQWGESL